MILEHHLISETECGFTIRLAASTPTVHLLSGLNTLFRVWERGNNIITLKLTIILSSKNDRINI